MTYNVFGGTNCAKNPSYITCMHVDASESGSAKVHAHFVK